MVTLAEAEGLQAPTAPADATFLVRRCADLVTKDFELFDVEDLRIMLGQGLGVRTLLPIAVELLVENPLVSGDFYPGDLLTAVMRLPEASWAELPSQRARLAEGLRRMTPTDEQLHADVTRFVDGPE